jgi:anti-anti-sigma regulatory factor
MATPTSVEALVPGDHACLTFSDAEERLDVVAAFVRDGLGQGQKVLCFTESLPVPALTAELTERGAIGCRGARDGQLTVRGCDEYWLPDGTFTAAQVISTLAAQVKLARREGYAGLRISADMCWATRPVSGVEQLLVFEVEVNELFTDGVLTAICQYDRNSFDPVTLASIATAHPHALAGAVYHEDPVLRISRQHAPPGVRLAGELDFTRIPQLRQALAEAVRLDGDVHLNLRHLEFIDAAAATVVVQAGLGLTDERKMTVVCRDLVQKVLAFVGATDVPQLRIVVADGRT